MTTIPLPQVRTGIHLIEWLVVIAIIAIFAAILFPVFAQAREKAVAHPQQLQAGRAGHSQYVQDYDEQFPSGHYGVVVPVTTSSMAWPGRAKSIRTPRAPRFCATRMIPRVPRRLVHVASQYPVSLAYNYNVPFNGGAIATLNAPASTAMLARSRT